MSNIIDSIQLSGVTYTLSAETSGGTVDQSIISGSTNAVAGGAVYNKFDEVEQVTARALNDLSENKLDASAYTPVDLSEYWTSAETQSAITESVSGKVNVSDNQVPAYYKHYEGYYPAQNTYYDYGQGVDTVKCQTNVFGSSNYGQKIIIQVKDSSGNTYSGTSQVMSNKNHKTKPSYFLPSGMGDYLDVTFDIPETEWNTANARYIVYTAKSGYRITYAEDFTGYDGNFNTAAYIVTDKYYDRLFGGGQSADVIKNSIEPALQKLGESKQDTLSAGTGISISGNVISATGSSIEVSSAITSGDTNPVQGGVIYDKFDEVEQVTARALVDLNEKKQDVLSAGTNITISGNVISATGGGSVTVDTELDSGSTNPVQNKVIYNKIDEVEQVTARALVDLNESLSGKADTSAVRAIQDSLSGYVATSAVTSSVTSASTDSQIPTAKAVWEAASGGGTTYTAGRGIDITNDTISFSLPISAGTGENSIIEGNSTSAMSYYDHAEGYKTIANGYTYTAHAEGYQTSAITYSSHAEGRNTLAGGANSHAEGIRTIANNQSEHASGQYNVSNKANTTFGDSGNTLFSVGNGTANNSRHNAFEIRQNGDMYLNNGTSDIKLQDYLQIKVVKLTQQEYDALFPNYDSNTLYIIKD